MQTTPYQRLAARLDALPNGFPPAPDGAELRLLEKIYLPEEAALAAELRLPLETAAQIALRLSSSGLGDFDPAALQDQLKTMARKGLIRAARLDGGLGFGLMPFVVGVYEAQITRLDAEMARLFEDYYVQSFGQALAPQPTFHRVIPVQESVRMDMEIHPFESARALAERAQAWGVQDCICRKQQALIGNACEHPLDVCMAFAQTPGAFDRSPHFKALTLDQALDTLDRAARAGLVHTVSNVQEDVTYICNCCTCSCGILRGISEMGLANAVAHSAFLNQVNEDLCNGCELCIDSCQFNALSMQDYLAHVEDLRCVGCGVCVLACPDGALELVRRPESEILPIPENQMVWGRQRSAARGIDLSHVL